VCAIRTRRDRHGVRPEFRAVVAASERVDHLAAAQPGQGQLAFTLVAGTCPYVLFSQQLYIIGLQISLLCRQRLDC
jgi:hypothetical protein